VTIKKQKQLKMADMMNTNHKILNIKELKKYLKKHGSSLLTVQETDTYSTKDKQCIINATLQLKYRLIIESITIADTMKVNSRLIEITVIAEWFFCTFNVQMIRNKSFLSELNYTIDSFITLYNLTQPQSEHTNNSKRFKRTSKALIAMTINNLISRQGDIRSKNNSGIADIIKKLKTALSTAAKFDPIYQQIENETYDIPVADGFYSLIKNELEAFNNDRLESILSEFYDKFSDHEKRCTKFTIENEIVNSEWYDKE